MHFYHLKCMFFCNIRHNYVNSKHLLLCGFCSAVVTHLWGWKIQDSKDSIVHLKLQFYIYLTYNLIYFLSIFKKHIGSLTGYLDVLMYVPIVYGFLPEINVFVFIKHHIKKEIVLQLYSKITQIRLVSHNIYG